MTPQARAIARTMTLTAGLIAALLATGLPTIYFAISYQYALGAIDTQAELSARETGRLVFANPTMWMFEEVRLTEILERRSDSGVAEARRILDREGRAVAASVDPLARPVLSRRYPIRDAAGVIAELEVSRSLRPLLLESGAALGLALAVAALVFATIRFLPLRAIRQAYQSLADSERKYRLLYETMREGMALHEVVRDEEGRPCSLVVQDVNPACAAMLQLEAGAAAGRDVRSLLDGALAPFLPQLLDAAQGGEPCAFEVSLPDRHRTLRVSASAPAAGVLAALYEDVTERRQLQERLSHAQKLQAVGRLAGGVAHDFNNILTVILSFAAELGEALQGEQQQHAREIEKAGQRAAALTRQLLAFSRKQVFRPEVLSVKSVVEGVAAMIRRLIGQRIALLVEVADDAGCIYSDPSQFEQVLVNLAVNARDAMPEGGQLAIRARREARAPAPAPGTGSPAGWPSASGQCLVLTVSDTGVGMSEEIRARLFEPFFTTKPQGKGTGLGLAIVFGAIDQVGGSIQVESAPGKGSTFTLRVPCVENPAATAQLHPDGCLSPTGRGSVLLVDDEPQLRAAVRLYLGAGGYAVSEAPNGNEGLALFRERPEKFDIVLTDLEMPGMGGLALGRALQAVRPVPVLYMSGFSEELASGREELPAASILQKPFDRATLLARLQAALQGAAAPSARPTA